MAIFKKTTAVKVTAKPVAAAKKSAASKVSAMERQKMIEREAYFIAEKQGFQGDSHAHWIAAVKKIDAMLAKKR